MDRIAQVVVRPFLVGAVALTLFVGGSRPSLATAQTTAPFDLRDHPLYLIASYYNAIALQDYARAYSYWNGHAPGGATYQQFAQGFADVLTVHALARLPVAGGVAAGTAHADVPVVVLTTLKSGGSQIFAGCFHVVHYNVPVGAPPVVDPNWYLDSAALQPAVSVDFVQATNACSLTGSFPTPTGLDNQLSPLDLISSYYDAIAAHDYARAYAYWPNGAPGQTLAQFAQGFAGTGNIGVVVALSFTIGAAAGSVYASSPLLITATDWGKPQLFVGCVVARKSNVPVGNSITPDPNWYLYSANTRLVSTFDIGVQQVWDICPNP
jgi:hypothetical protein